MYDLEDNEKGKYPYKSVKVTNSTAKTLKVAEIENVSELAVIQSALSTLDTDSLSSLAILEISSCPLTELNTARLANLKLLVLWGSRIDALDLRPLAQLRELDVSWTRIGYLDLRWTPELEVLEAYKVAWALDISRCLQIKEIDVSEAAVARICIPRWYALERFDTELTRIKYLDFRGTNVVKRLQEPHGVLGLEPGEMPQGVGRQLLYYDEGYGVDEDGSHEAADYQPLA